MNVEQIPIVDITELESLKKPEIIAVFDETQRKLIKYCLDLKADYNKKLKELQDEYRLHPENVPQQDNLNEWKWKKPGRPSLSEDVVRRVRELRAQGLSVRAIGDRIGISRSSVSNIINRENE